MTGNLIDLDEGISKSDGDNAGWDDKWADDDNDDNWQSLEVDNKKD